MLMNLVEVPSLNEPSTRAAELSQRLASENSNKIKTLDIFIFNDDELKRLDSYISVNRPSTAYLQVESGSGDKLMVMVANIADKSFSAAEISTYESLEEKYWELKDEDPNYPVMSGTCSFCAGSDGYTPIQLTPIMSNVCLDFIKCNFSGRGYTSKELENAVVYLTNVSGRAEIMRENGFRIKELVNAGSLDKSYLGSMTHPELLYSKVVPKQWKPVNLYCYPNDGADGVVGSQHTKMVVQGDIDGATYYYPIEINQEGYGYSSGPHGVSRNVKYSYNLTITRKGSTDPDTPVDPDTVVESGWIELHPAQFITGTNDEQIHVWCDMYPEDTPLDICTEDLDFDVANGIYTYELDPDGHGVMLTLKENGTGMFTIDAGYPINQGFLVMVVVNP